VSDGTIEQSEERVLFRYERWLHHPIDVVWRTITDPLEIEKWTGSRPDIEFRVGGEYGQGFQSSRS
jgi:uncharacterized protein YndB with AHSA1/START domain